MMQIPITDPQVSLRALQAWIQDGSILSALEAFHAGLGDIFQINLPGFKPIMLVGPDANRFMLVEERDHLKWREERDPVTKLLRQGVLVVDGTLHDDLRLTMNPALHKKQVETYIETMMRRTDDVLADWQAGQTRDMLIEMRRIALLILVDTLFGVDMLPEVDRLWTAVLRVIDYISPGVWMLWRGVPRPGYQRYIRAMDNYLYRIIALRRLQPCPEPTMLDQLIASQLDDDLIRDQLLTMLIAGHDTSTALLAWALLLMGQHPDVMAQAQAEVDQVIGHEVPHADHLKDLRYLGQITDETLRLYPPIHLGARTAAVDLNFKGYHLPAGQRVLYSIYLMHRHPAYWTEPATFKPERFAPDQPRPEPYTYLPFGGGKRNCIGALFGQVESKLVLARVLQRFDLQLLPDRVHPHMGATLEPRPGVRMRVDRHRA